MIDTGFNGKYLAVLSYMGLARVGSNALLTPTFLFLFEILLKIHCASVQFSMCVGMFLYLLTR